MRLQASNISLLLYIGESAVNEPLIMISNYTLRSISNLELNGKASGTSDLQSKVSI